MFQIKLLMPRRYSCVPCLMNPPDFDPGPRSPFSWQPQTPEDRMFCLFDKINLELKQSEQSNLVTILLELSKESSPAFIGEDRRNMGEAVVGQLVIL